MTETSPVELSIIEVTARKSDYMDLLLIGDESEEMVRRYVDVCNLYVGFVDGVAVSCIAALAIDAGTVEVKNLAVIPESRRRGVGRRMLAHVEGLHAGCKICLGTGETPSTIRFYQSCGYRYSHRVIGFFTDNYPDPIVEEGITIRDMLYLSKLL